MNITELRYLVAIKKWGSVSAAAKQLYAAQPNVSKALKNLEGEYGLRIFERSSTGMIPTEQGRRFIEQAARVLEEVDRLTEDAHHARERCAELRVMIPHATYASYAAVDFLKEAAGADQLRIHIREGGSMEALDFVLRRGYHLALLRYAAEDDDHYIHYCARRGLKMEPVMEFEYQLLTNRDGPLAKHEVKDLSELNHYMEIMHDDFQLPGEDGGDGVRWHVNDSRRIHVYERCSQFSILQQLPSAYMVQPAFYLAAAALSLYVGLPHAPAGAGPVPSGAQKMPRPASGHAGRAGLPRPRRAPVRRTGIHRPAPPGSRPHGKMRTFFSSRHFMRKSHEKRQKSASPQHSAQKRARIFGKLPSGHFRNRFKEKQPRNSIASSLKYGPHPTNRVPGHIFFDI